MYVYVYTPRRGWDICIYIRGCSRRTRECAGGPIISRDFRGRWEEKGRSNQIGNSWVMQEDVGEIDPGLCFWDWTRVNDSAPAVGGSSSGEARGKVSFKSQQ